MLPQKKKISNAFCELVAFSHVHREQKKKFKKNSWKDFWLNKIEVKKAEKRKTVDLRCDLSTRNRVYQCFALEANKSTDCSKTYCKSNLIMRTGHPVSCWRRRRLVKMNFQKVFLIKKISKEYQTVSLRNILNINDSQPTYVLLDPGLLCIYWQRWENLRQFPSNIDIFSWFYFFYFY